MRTFVTILVILFTLSPIIAQVKIPEPSPKSTISQAIGLSMISVEYGRPSAKGRKVFGDLVPWNTVWRTGANQCTVLKFDTDLLFDSHKVKSGTYALFTIPKQNTWTIILNKDADQWGAFQYNSDDDVLRFDVVPELVDDKTETFDIGFRNLTDSTANMVLTWDNTSLTITIRTELDAMMRVSIGKMISENSTNSWDYYFAAQYYFNNKGEKDKSLEWMKKSIELDPIFWIVFNYATMLEKVGNKKEALEVARRSLDLSKEANEQTFIENQVRPLIDRLSVK